ncbi:MAG: N-acetylmuramoyl-L-alanine amidase [Labedaea sp.]
MIVPGAQWRGPVPNRTQGGMREPSLGLVLHVIEGSIGAADSVFHNPGRRASAHWGVGADGSLLQWVDTADKAWAEVAGNALYHSVETEGFHNQALTDAQVATLARLYLWGHDTYGWPFAVVDAPGQRGLITHGDGGAAWGGHFDCPGPQRSAQRAAIIQRAAGGGPKPPAQEDDPMVVISTTDGPGMLLLLPSGTVFGLNDAASASAFLAAGAKEAKVSGATFKRFMDRAV